MVKRAFLIGISDYDNPSKFVTLNYSVNHIEEFANILIESGEYNKNEVILLTNSKSKEYQPSRSQIMKQFINFLKDVQNGDNIIIYFIGHGGSFKGLNYIFPKDAQYDIEDFDLIQNTSISLNWFIAKLDKKNAETMNIFFIIDACREKMAGSQSLSNIKNSFGISSFQDLKYPSYTTFFYSCGQNQNAWSFEYEGKERSIFSHALLNGLKEIKRPITFENLIKYTKSKVTEISRLCGTGTQIPMELISSEARDKIILGETNDILNLKNISETNIIVFINYAKEDKKLFNIEAIVKELTKFKAIQEVFYYKEHIYTDINEFIKKGLGNCDIVLLFCSENIFNSDYISQIQITATILNKPIIPILAKDTNNPFLFALKDITALRYDPQYFKLFINDLYIKILEMVSESKDSIIKLPILDEFKVENINTQSQKETNDFISNMSTKIKILLVCPSDDVKELLINKFIRNRFAANYKLTVGVDILTKDVEYKPNKLATISIWNIQSNQRFEFIRSTFYKNASGVILIFDLSNNYSYIKTKEWFAEIRQYTSNNIPFVFIGYNDNLIEKSSDIVNRSEVKAFTKSEGGIYVETSIKSGENIEYAFKELTNQIINSIF